MSATSFRLGGGHVLVGLLLFFAAIITINVAFAIAAVRTFPGEDERRSYTQGLHYNAVLTERREQAALGWRAHTQLAETSSGARVVVVLNDRTGAPITAANIEGVLRWAPSENGDRELRFTSLGQGRYAAELGALPPGRWLLRARAQTEAERSLNFEAELTWPSTH